MGVQQRDPLAQLRLPAGFRFYPTDEELMVEYLCRKIAGYRFDLPIIAEIDLYKFDPWILPSKALFGEKEWYFFSPRDRKYPNGSRPNRVAGSGYWKATGTDKIILTEGRIVGIKKALVFYVGKAPKGTKTNWIMHEYRLSQPVPSRHGSSKLDDWVLCRIYKKHCSAAAKETESATSTGGSSSASSTHLDDVFDSIPEMDLAFPVMNSQRQVPGFGSGNPDWIGFVGSTVGPEVESVGLGQAHYQQGQFVTGTCLPSVPQMGHVESATERLLGRRMEEEVNSLGEVFGQSSGLLMGQNYPDRVHPYGIRFSAPMGGFGFEQ